MTGVVGGSRGTGIRAGSQGTGVSGASPLAPTTPTGLAITVVSPTALTVSWNDVVDETSYELEVSVNGEAYVPAVGSPYAADVVSVPLTGLVPGVFYCYRVRATNAFGSSAWSSSVCQFTPNGTENVLVQLNGLTVGTYSAPFDVNPPSVSDSLTTPVPNPIETLFVTENFAPADADLADVTDALTTPVPLAVDDLFVTETVTSTTVETATVTDALDADLGPAPATPTFLIASAAMASGTTCTLPDAGGFLPGDIALLIRNGTLNTPTVVQSGATPIATVQSSGSLSMVLLRITTGDTQITWTTAATYSVIIFRGVNTGINPVAGAGSLANGAVGRNPGTATRNNSLNVQCAQFGAAVLHNFSLAGFSTALNQTFSTTGSHSCSYREVDIADGNLGSAGTYATTVVAGSFLLLP
jgi:hypothetical protein